MSEYTTEVRFICETLAGYDMSQGYGKVSDVIDNSWQKVFDFDFPIFDPDYRSILCKKILMHYYTREIGFETVGLWKLKLQTKMNEIMPYYNKLYYSETLEYNPLYDADYTREHEGSDSGTSSDDGTHGGTVTDTGSHGGTVTDAGTHGGNVNDIYSKSGTVNDENENTNWNVFSDTPQGALTNVENETYLTDARKITDDGSNDREYEESGGNTRTYNETTGNTRTYNETNGNTRTYNETTGVDREFENTNEFAEHIVGKMPGKSYAKMIMEYRESLLNIDMQIIDDLRDLFIKLW